MLRRRHRALLSASCLLVLLTPLWGNASSACSTRRCLSKMLIDKAILTQPQDENCTQTIYVPFIEYQTLSVDTKKLRFSSRLMATMNWVDPELAWNSSEYNFEMVTLPVNKVWTPELHITNAISTSLKHGSQDLLVYSDGTLTHKVILNALVDCEVNMFRYPFARDNCPVAIQAWENEGCGMKLSMGSIYMVDGNHGDWRTNSVALLQVSDVRNYIMVELSIRYLNPFISLILPSVLVLILDVVSFALPLGGGERNCFKVTLALSFIMFLIILNDLLPGDSQCSPIIRTHFCVCLVFLVLSMVETMLLTRVARDGLLLSCSCWKKKSPKDKDDEEILVDEDLTITESKSDISVIQLEESQALPKVIKFLGALSAKDLESQRFQDLANKYDKIFFWLYLILSISYFCILICIYVSYPCSINHFNFWY